LENSEQKAAVKFISVSKCFGSCVVLEQISFQLTAGQGLCICGPNAVGKTTLIKITAGLFKPDQGKVEICGVNFNKQNLEAKTLIGAVFHKPMVYPQLTVIENLQFFAKLYGIKNPKQRINRVMEQTQLKCRRYDKCRILSRGTSQRLAIARAMLHEPVVLLADEPFTGLDTEAADLLIDMLNDFKSRAGSIVMTTHNVNFALKCCERVAVLDNRKMIFNRKVAEINSVEFVDDYLEYARERY